MLGFSQEVLSLTGLSYDAVDDLTKWTYSAILGSGVLTALIQIGFSIRIGARLEAQKSLLLRQTKVHEEQITALCLIHANLKRANYFFQRLSAGNLRGNENGQDLFQHFTKFLATASDLRLDNELLLPETLTRQMQTFFDKTQSALVDLDIAMDPATGDERGRFRESATTVAFKELPALLTAIATEARAIIHVTTN